MAYRIGPARVPLLTLGSPSDRWAAVAQLVDGHLDLDPPRQELGAAVLVTPFELVALGEQRLYLPR